MIHFDKKRALIRTVIVGVAIYEHRVCRALKVLDGSQNEFTANSGINIQDNEILNALQFLNRHQCMEGASRIALQYLYTWEISACHVIADSLEVVTISNTVDIFHP